MSKYKMYFLHDPIGNNEQQITNFDKETIQQSIDRGMIVVGVTQDDVREIVKSIDDIVEPQIASVQGFTMVLPSYVDAKIDNLAKIIEELIDVFGISKLIKTSALNNIKESIQKIHDETLKTIETDKKMIESSTGLIKNKET